MEKLSYSLIYLGSKPSPTPNRPSQPPLFLFHAPGLAKPAAAQLPPSTVRPTDPSPQTAGPARPSLQFSSHGPGEAQWPAPDEPSSSSPWRPCRRTGAAHPHTKRSSPNRIETDPLSNPTTLRDRVPVVHVKDLKSPINRTPLHWILAQN
jgi:hypothetical protein